MTTTIFRRHFRPSLSNPFYTQGLTFDVGLRITSVRAEAELPAAAVISIDGSESHEAAAIYSAGVVMTTVCYTTFGTCDG